MRPLLALPFVALVAFVVSCSGGAGGEGDAPKPPSGAPTGPFCEAAAASDVEVASDDRDGYAPYALDACALAYVSRTGDLVLRDLVTRSETIAASSAEHPRRPALAVSSDSASPLLAWEATISGKSVVRVMEDGAAATIEGAFVSAGEPRARAHLVAFTAWNGPSANDDTDVWLYDVRAKSARLVVGGPGQQRFADVSSTHVVATDFSEDPDGRHDGAGDLADLVVYDLASGVATPRPAPGKQAFPMLAVGSSGTVLAYLEWGLVHPEPKLESYVLRAGALSSDPSTYRAVAEVRYVAAHPARPALAGDTIEWIANPDGRATLLRAPIDGSSRPTAVSGLDGLFLFGPAASPRFTVVGAFSTAAADRTPRLRAVVR